MKSWVILVILLIAFAPLSFAKEISIPELFTSKDEETKSSGKESYF